MSHSAAEHAGYMSARRGESPEESKKHEKDFTPHEKGEFRRAYWKGRVRRSLDDLQGCAKYLCLEDAKVFWERLEALYIQTLTDMYGEEEAKRFLEETRKPMKADSR